MAEQLKKTLNNPDTIVSLFLGLAVVIVVGIMIFNYFRQTRPAPATNGNGAATTEQATGSATGATTYTVKLGDSLWSIAESTVGSGYNWTDIAKENNLNSPDSIEVGQKLTIPKVAKRESGQTASESIAVKKPADGKYTVKQGDSLWKISESVYGTGYRWNEIAKANNLAHPNLIHTGNVLSLP